MSRVKKIPIESTCAEFWKVVFIPDPAPRCSGGRLFMTPARFGEPNMDMVSPVAKRRTAKTQYEKSIGSSSSNPKQTAVPTMPPVANGRAP